MKRTPKIATLPRRRFLRLMTVGLGGTIAACGSAPAPAATNATAAPTSLPATSSPAPVPTTAPTPRPIIAEFPRATSASVAVADDGAIYVVFGRDTGLFVARSADGGRTFGEAAQVNPDAPAMVMAVERPAITADGAGNVGVTWLHIGDDHKTAVRYARSVDGARSFGAAVLVHASSAHETAMARMTLDEAGHPIIAWLEDGALRVARSADHGATFPVNQVADREVCDCCQPHPLVHGGQLLVAYRNLERDAEGQDIRDIYVAASGDGGKSFADGVRASDAPWRLNACPIAGPALAAHGERLYVAWMDGRNDPELTGERSDIWLATSDDGGRTFSANLRVNPVEGAFTNLPVLAIGPNGRLHIGWESAEEQPTRRQVIYIATSDDGGRTFGEPWAIVNSEDGTRRGRPNNATLAVSRQGRLHMTWVDGLGAHIGSWDAV